MEFINNNGSALAVYDTTVSFSEGCSTSFISNSAWMGGAIALLGASQMWINPHTIFVFRNNKAELRGGAIYVLQTSRHDLLSGGNCFMQYNDHSVSSLDDWITKFIFDKNQAYTGLSIFATTLLSCEWGATFGDLNFTLLNVLNWTTLFSYNPSDSNTIATEVAKMHHQHQQKLFQENFQNYPSQLWMTKVMILCGLCGWYLPTKAIKMCMFLGS